MATMKKTNKELFIAVLSVIANAEIPENEREELTAFINGRIEQIEKKAATPSKADREKTELNEKLKADIIAGMTEIDRPVRVSELIKLYAPLSNYTTQKLTPILTALVADGKITKATVKRDTVYNIA